MVPSFRYDVPDVLIQATHLIMNGYLDDHTIDELAKTLYMSECHLRRIFRNELGISPARAAQNRRLENARRMVLLTDMKLIDIAYESGFQSLRSFNHAFKAVFKMAPSQMRKLERQDVYNLDRYGA